MVKKLFRKIQKGLSAPRDVDSDEVENEYLELDTDADKASQKLNLKFFTLDDFTDVKPILDGLREGYTISLVNIRPLKERDIVELKRAINKLKKTCDAADGDIAGFGEDYVVVAPGFVKIHRTQGAKEPQL